MSTIQNITKLLVNYLFFIMILCSFSISLVPIKSIGQEPTFFQPPHLDLEMTGFEYQALEEKLPIVTFQGANVFFEDIYSTGKRNLDWIRLLNKNSKTPISLSTPETQQGYPINQPRIYNPSIIRGEYNDLKKNMPQVLKDIIFSTDPLPTELPTTLNEYIYWGLKVDRVYQIAVRWKTLEPSMNYLKSNSVNDVRGYYYLTNTEGFPEKLKDWTSLNKEEKTQAELWLYQMCRNSLKNYGNCQSRTQEAIKNNSAFDFFSKHKISSQEIIDDMMLIPNKGIFKKVNWITENEISVPFKSPNTNEMGQFLLSNIELEWQKEPFALKIQFVPRNNFGVDVIWEPGVTPHVPQLGSNLIYMDANAPISEYDVQWTIRHEFGHVMGFPDCYIEFFDDQLDAIVGYQMDINDIMCSRRGHLRDRHVLELKRVYQ